MKLSSRISTALLLLLPLAGCARMMAQHCTEGRAYEGGLNDARQGNDANSAAYVVLCEEQNKAALSESYRKGYADALGSNRITIEVAPQRECVSGYGKEVCGYDCVKAYGEVKCAASPEHNCVEAYGQIQCGRNCRKSYGQIACDG